MSSSRRLNKISIELESLKDDYYYESEVERLEYKYLDYGTLNFRLIEIIEKYKPHLEKLKINLHPYFWDHYVQLVSAASDVEELRFGFRTVQKASKPISLELKKFTKLKRLHVYRHPRPKHLFDAIPDNCLEEFTIEPSPEYSISDIQEFVNRQRRIKKWRLAHYQNINLEQLALEELTIGSSEEAFEDGLTTVVEKQTELRYLKTSYINDDTFEKVCCLQKLEILHVTLDCVEDKSLISGLNNLKMLTELELTDNDRGSSEFWEGSPYLGSVTLPNLRKLTLRIRLKLDPQIIVNFGNGGMENIEELRIQDGKLNILPSIIENLQKLKVLTFEADRTTKVETELLAPLRKNNSLESLHLNLAGRPREPNYEIISACPNLKTLDLIGLGYLDASLLISVKSLTKLTSFSFIGHGRPSSDTMFLDPTLAGFIDHFEKTPNFIKMLLDRIPEFKKNLVSNMIPNNFEKMVGVGYIRILKKPKVLNPPMLFRN